MKTTKLNFANANSSLSRSEMRNIMAGSNNGNNGGETNGCWCPGAGCGIMEGACTPANCGGREGCERTWCN